jgi:hypothetical protein
MGYSDLMETTGRIAEGLVFNRALTAAEIRGLMDGDIEALGFLPVQVEA